MIFTPPRRELWTPRHRWDTPLPGHTKPRYFAAPGRRRLLLGGVPAAAAGIASYNAQIESLNPLAWWKMQEGSGNIANSGSLTGIDGTPTGNPTYQNATSLAADIQYGIDFDAVGDYFDIDHHASLDFERTDSFTILWWCNRTASGSHARQFGKYSTLGWSSGSWYPSSTNFFEPFITDTNANQIVRTTDAGQPTGSWQFYALTYDGTSTNAGMTIHRNGAVEASTGSGGPLDSTIQTGVAMSIGRDPGSAQLWNGLISQFAIFNSVLSAGDLSTLNTLGRP